MKQIKLVTVFFIFLFNSCVDLEKVNTFSSTAIKTLQSYVDVKYSFSSSYIDYSVGHRLPIVDQKEIVSNKLDTKNLSSDPTLISLNKKADQTIAYFISCIISYFQGISKVSSKELVNYNFDNLSKNLKGDTTIKAKLNINDVQIDAASKVARTFANQIMGKYRVEKLRQVLVSKDSDLNASINALVQALQALNNNLSTDIGLIQNSYLRILGDEKINDPIGKINLKQQCLKELADLNLQSSKINLLIEGLQKIKEAHHNVVQSLSENKLNENVIVSLLEQYSTEVFNIFEQIKLLNNNQK